MHGYSREPIRVYLIDDHDIVRRGLLDLMSAKHDISVVGDSGDDRQAADRIVRAAPDVLVADLRLDGGSGVRVCRDVRSKAPAVRFLLLTSAHEDEALAACLLCGASGYQTKLVNSSDILENVRRVGSGRDLISAEDAARARARLLAQDGYGELDRVVLARMLDGWTDERIAEDLDLDPGSARAAVDRVIARATSEA
ncbi:MAG TPA: response regulator transcription factor [Nocardioidaceae bacterium]|nr:response regulator transcription factor [Nocardioidaceae bacterium]